MARSLQGDEAGPQWELHSVSKVEQYFSTLEKVAPEIVILDIHLGEASPAGVALVAETKRRLPRVVILMCSAMDDASTIAHCQSLGADEFISKKTQRSELGARIYQSYRLVCLKRGVSPLNEKKINQINQIRKVTGAGTTFEKLSKRIPLVIQSAVSAVHIEGESGTGKEVVADIFASLLPLSTPFIKVNCGAISPTLLESELFGHVKGAFTGAISDKKGLLEAASGGWIFLDEVASLSSNAQVALLRALENQELRRVGASQNVNVQVKVLSATNEPLQKLVGQGSFRKDLWQRLCEAEIQLPPLREREEEIPALVAYFCEQMPGGPYRIDEAAMEVLCHYSWESGNIRELRNCLRAMTELQVNRLLTTLSIPERIWKQMERKEGNASVEGSSGRGETILPDRAELRLESESSEAINSQKTTDDVNPSYSDSSVKWELKVSTPFPVQFDELSDRLLVELLKKHHSLFGRSSLRKLAKLIGMSRSTLSGRLKSVVQDQMVSLSDLNQWIGSGD